jgi:uracil-DNA glycosylase family 4
MIPPAEFKRHVERWRHCTLCPLGVQRTNIVLARGQVPCDVLFVGEAPGVSEDVLGQPFVGEAGHELDGWITQADQARYDDHEIWNASTPPRIAFTNLVACFPREAKARGDNEPTIKEISACTHRLVEFVQLCKPRGVVLVGKLADKCFPNECRRTVDVLVSIMHPAFVLREKNLNQKANLVRSAVLTLKYVLEELNRAKNSA